MNLQGSSLLGGLGVLLSIVGMLLFLFSNRKPLVYDVFFPKKPSLQRLILRVFAAMIGFLGLGLIFEIFFNNRFMGGVLVVLSSILALYVIWVYFRKTAPRS